jgi:hypothetical protein
LERLDPANSFRRRQKEGDRDRQAKFARPATDRASPGRRRNASRRSEKIEKIASHIASGDHAFPDAIIDENNAVLLERLWITVNVALFGSTRSFPVLGRDAPQPIEAAAARPSADLARQSVAEAQNAARAGDIVAEIAIGLPLASKPRLERRLRPSAKGKGDSMGQ